LPDQDPNKKPALDDKYPMPVRKVKQSEGSYDIYPAYVTENDRIFAGYNTLAARIENHRIIKIDGYCGVFFNEIRDQINEFLTGKGFTTSWISTFDLLKSAREISKMTTPFSGGDDPLFGKRATLSIIDFFRPGVFESVFPDPAADYSFIIGPGASVASWDGLTVYADVPKNEIRKRALNGLVTNLGMTAPSGIKEMYKLFYFVDWIVLNMHKNEILPLIDIFIDTQRPSEPVWMEGKTLRQALSSMSRDFFRAKPWFESGAWGGTWIRDHVEGIDKKVPNYAWSYELISPENGLIIESSSILCEISFDLLMFQEAESILGDCHADFGTDFPIRFDYLDTFDGGNLSLQCHPQLDYMREKFGEGFTQEEAYYILDAKDDASVYLGFRDDIVPDELRAELEHSHNSGMTMDPEKYILRHPSRKHDFFLIPPGTIHGSGRNNMVLEISSTPYIFTFKMYDWQRPDLDGKPRPLNISRGMENLCFDRKGKYVAEHLICHPYILAEGPDWKLWHLPTHEKHFYDVKRYQFMSEIEINTAGKCLVLNLAGGRRIELQSLSGYTAGFNYAETFIIPAAAGTVRIKNLSEEEAILVFAFVK
jgi:mannose-6-phosphate isomerase class I